jgi:hypothetical protein
MTLLLDLPPEIESKLQSQARATGVSVEEYALKLLARESAMNMDAQPIQFSKDRFLRRKQLSQLMTASPEVRTATLQSSAQAAAEYYDSAQGREELSA